MVAWWGLAMGSKKNIAGARRTVTKHDTGALYMLTLRHADVA